MTYWLNHVAVDASPSASHTLDPSNPTAIGTVVDGSAFTPTSGRLLVCIVGGPVTSATPSGWTLPSGGSAVSTDGLYVFYKTAAGSDTLATTHNSGSYRVIFDFYEFPATASFGVAASFPASASGSTKTLTGLTGSNLVMAPVCAPGTAGAFTFTGATKHLDVAPSDAQSRTAVASIYSSASSVGVAATSAAHEQLAFSIAGISVPATGSLAASLLTPTVALSGSYRDVGSLGIVLPRPTIALVGNYAGTLSGSLALSPPVPDLALTGDYTAPPHPMGTFDARLPLPRLALEGDYFGSTGTDTSNVLDGLSLGGFGVWNVQAAAASPPTVTATVRVDKAVALPAPVLVKGRPT